ncbi:MAG: CYTH domain-containing protein [Oceanospirillaceae bacterium]|nr:CYTH domain-containing protein [Oceanospirillaceae bacterium]
MAREIELKLSLAEEGVSALRALPLLASEADFRGTSRLHNRYFDTASQALAANRVALRIREDDGRFVQTLKTRGASQGGLHQRNEWEWELSQPALDYSLLADASWPVSLDDPALLQQIVPAFRTDFERSTWLLRRPSVADGEAVIELVLDRGEVTTAAGGRDALCEVELELKAGTAEDLYGVALELAAAVPLLVSDISKAERGYRLLAREPLPETVGPRVADGMSSGDAFQALVEESLNDLSRGLELWREAADWLAVTRTALALQRLRATLACFGALLPSESKSLLTQLGHLNCELDQALAWRTLLPEIGEDQVAGWAAQQAPVARRRLDALLRSPEPGLLLLRCSRLLLDTEDAADARQPLAFFTPELDKLPL